MERGHPRVALAERQAESDTSLGVGAITVCSVDGSSTEKRCRNFTVEMSQEEDTRQPSSSFSRHTITLPRPPKKRAGWKLDEVVLYSSDRNIVNPMAENLAMGTIWGLI
eukprot:jgi/Bigna1/125984/aug1.1_g692